MNCELPPCAGRYFTRLYKLLALPRPPATFRLVLTNSSAVSLSIAHYSALAIQPVKQNRLRFLCNRVYFAL
jgi:hypothetical protein